MRNNNSVRRYTIYPIVSAVPPIRYNPLRSGYLNIFLKQSPFSMPKNIGKGDCYVYHATIGHPSGVHVISRIISLGAPSSFAE